MVLQKSSDEPKARTSYTIALDEIQMARLGDLLHKRGWERYPVDHASFAYRGDKVSVVGYRSGKVVVQGKKTEDFVTYILEAEVTGEARMGYDAVHNPEWYEPHAGLDESGKGDLFGPLVSACVIADGKMVGDWQKAGIQDSKRITGDASILRLERVIRKTPGVVVESVYAGMTKYNELYTKFGSNLNSLLAWMHAKALESALKKRNVPWGMLDQFSRQPLVQRYFLKTGFDLRMQTKAEADPVVAAASIIARAEYIRQMEKLSEMAGEPLLRGASRAVKEQGVRIVRRQGSDALVKYAKMHFKTAREVQALAAEPA